MSMVFSIYFYDIIIRIGFEGKKLGHFTRLKNMYQIEFRL